MRVFSRFVDRFGLRAEFPVLANLAYLNAGTDGPLPARAVHAAAEELEREAGRRAARSPTSNAAASSAACCARPTRGRSAPIRPTSR